MSFASTATEVSLSGILEIIELEAAIKRQQVKTLVHFTHISNLKNIMRYGLLPRNELAENNIRFVKTDAYRMDQNRDALCLSVTFPNYKMFWCKRQALAPNSNWVVLELDPKLLVSHDVRYMPTNAASNRCNALDTSQCLGAKGFNEMFSFPELRNAYGTPAHWPTDPQAEVQVLERIDPMWIKSVCVHDLVGFLKAKGNVGDVPIEIKQDYFERRGDHQYW